MRRFRDNDHGATAVLVAACLIGLVAFGGLVIDGGNAYAQRRQMQNAADSAALAGANALYKYKQNPALGSASIYAAALDEATSNDAKPGTFQCTLVRLNQSGAEVGTQDCPQSNLGSVPADAFKVRVKVDADHGTQLLSIVGIDSFNARGNAAASLQAASIGAGPIMVCGTAVTADDDPPVAGAPHSIPLLVPDVNDPTGFKINPAAVGHIYDLWGNDVKNEGRDCGDTDKGTGKDSFRGLVDNTDSHDLPGWWPSLTGNKAGKNIQLPLIGGCQIDNDDSKIKDIPANCEFALPLCVLSNGKGGSNLELYCVKVGRFRTLPQTSGTPDLEGEFLGGGVVNSGGGNGVPTDQDVVVIKLVE